MKQLPLFKMPNAIKPFRNELGKRKVIRPLSTKHPIHLILNSKHNNFRKREREVIALWNLLGLKFGIKVENLVLNSNHCHAEVFIHSRVQYRKFIRALTSLLYIRFQIKLMASPLTRIVTWGRDRKTLKKYFSLNWLEARGAIEYRPNRTVGWEEPMFVFY